MFTSGDRSPCGCGHAVRTIYNDVRTTAADYLNDVEPLGNLEIKNNIYVDKVVLGLIGKDIRAIGVDLQAASGNRTSIRARREVVLAP